MTDKNNMEQKVLNEENLEKVNGGVKDKQYGDSIPSGDMDKLAPGTKIVYTDKFDEYQHHFATFWRCESWSRIVLTPDDQECKDFFEQLNKYEHSNMDHKLGNGNEYLLFYGKLDYNYIFLA